jgi:hypothetical protein
MVATCCVGAFVRDSTAAPFMPGGLSVVSEDDMAIDLLDTVWLFFDREG